MKAECVFYEVRHCFCVFTAFVAKTQPLPCASTAVVAKTQPLPCASTAAVAKTQPLPCASTAFVASIPSFLAPSAGQNRVRRSDLRDGVR